MASKKQPTDPKAANGSSKALDALIAGCNESCPRCHAKITAAQMQEMFPAAPEERRETARNAFNECNENFELIRCLRKAHLFAQILGESGSELDPKGENTHFSRKNIKKLWPHRDLLGTYPDLGALADAGDAEGVANRVYANRSDLGNGDVASGDGYRFRGHGYIQITGKATFTAVQQTMDSKYPSNGLDILKNGDEVVQPRGGMISAMAYWYWKGLNRRADLGDASATVNKITHLVRGGVDAGIDARRVAAYHTTMKTFRTPECVDRKKPSIEARPWTRAEGNQSIG